MICPEDGLPGQCGTVHFCSRKVNLSASQHEPTPQAPTAPSSEQLVKDAARYRWLREQHVSDGRSWHIRLPSNDVGPVDIDAAIDEAISTPPCK